MSSQEIQHIIQVTQVDLDAAEAKIQPARVDLANAKVSGSTELVCKAREALTLLRSDVQAAVDAIVGLQHLAAKAECAELGVALSELLSERQPIAAEADALAEQIELLDVPPFTPDRFMERSALKQQANDVRTNLLNFDQRETTIKARLEELHRDREPLAEAS